MKPVVRSEAIERLGVSLSLLRRLVDRSNPYAMTKFARMLLKGWVVQRDPAAAVVMLRGAARQGWGPAARLLAGIFQLGLHGIQKNLEASAYWDRKSAEVDQAMRSRYRASPCQGATVLHFPEGHCLEKLPQGHGCVLWR